MTVAEAQAQLPELVARVCAGGDRVTLTTDGCPAVVLIAAEELESIEETLEIVSDPDTMRRLAASEAELAAGEGVGLDDLAAAIRSRRS